MIFRISYDFHAKNSWKTKQCFCSDNKGDDIEKVWEKDPEMYGIRRSNRKRPSTDSKPPKLVPQVKSSPKKSSSKKAAPVTSSSRKRKISTEDDDDEESSSEEEVARYIFIYFFGFQRSYIFIIYFYRVKFH